MMPSGRRWSGLRALATATVAALLLLGVPLSASAAEPTGTVSGTVSLDRDPGDPGLSSSMFVTAYHDQSRAEVWTWRVNSDGTFSITLPPGRYVLSAGASTEYPQILPAYSGGGSSLADATPVTVVAGQVTTTDLTLTLGGQVQMDTLVQPAPGGELRYADPPFTVWRFDRVDPVTGAILATAYPTFYVDGIPPADILSEALYAGTYNVSISSRWYVNGPREATGQIYFTGSVQGIVVQPGQITRVGQVVLETDYFDQIPVYRFWSPVFQGHFYTADQAERDAVIATMPSLWSYEGIAFWAFPTQHEGTVPLHRFWSSQFRGHFYTADASEKEHVIRAYRGVWEYEGVAFYVYPPAPSGVNTDSVARFWGPGVRHHFYTASGPEAEQVRRTLASMWTYEGIAFRVPHR